MNSIQDRWNQIQEKLSRQSHKVTVVAVSKKQSVEKIIEAYEAGIRDFGENYVQEALPKIETLRDKTDIQWHYVGALQTNKMNKIVPVVSYLHAIDQVSQIEKLQKMKTQGTVLPKLLIQINLAGEETKSGLEESQIKTFMENVSSNTDLEICGLMTFPPLQSDPEKNRLFFVKARQWKETINDWKLPRIKIEELSMGVSSDYQVAVGEGATIVRLGEVLFGPR